MNVLQVNPHLISLYLSSMFIYDWLTSLPLYLFQLCALALPHAMEPAIVKIRCTAQMAQLNIAPPTKNAIHMNHLSTESLMMGADCHQVILLY